MIKPKVYKELEIEKLNEKNEFNNCKFLDEELNRELLNLELDGCVFKNIDFSNYKFTCKGIIDCIFEDCLFSNLEVYEYLSRCHFKNCKLVGLSLNSIQKVSNIFFEECNLNYSLCADTVLDNVLFKECTIKEGSFYNIKHKNISFENCDLTSCEFLNFKLQNVDLSTCNISKIRFNINDVYGVVLNQFQLIDIAGVLGIEIKY